MPKGATTGRMDLLTFPLGLNGLVFGEPHGPSAPSRASYIPVFAHLAIVLAAGVWLPPALVAWFQHVASRLS